ncbi:MAG TPA: NAD-dependent protein deacetylase, partial [Deltaproteobacteria bacterium]|nr:NAD-dependent protein deacetylase [Deltaproteobacteria bacterium]
AGAGMGVDSGLPDFRGNEGFWRAYPPFQGMRFEQLANPRWFRDDPGLAWGFYGHRLGLYRQTVPHPGFAVLLRWAQRRITTVFTSNVDGQFQRAGFPESLLYEVHGSIHHLQCATPCAEEIWPAEGVSVSIDPETFRAHGALPRCPRCGGIARPNILMFGDWGYLGTRSDVQATRYASLRRSASDRPAVVIELGAGSAVPTVRHHSERLVGLGATLIRINPREPEGPRGSLGLPLGGAEALACLAQRLRARAIRR